MLHDQILLNKGPGQHRLETQRRKKLQAIMHCTSSQQRLGLMIYAFWEEKTSPPHLTELEVRLYSELDQAGYV